MATGARERAGAPDPLIVIAVACLLVIGIVMVMSSSSVTSHLQYGDPYWYAKRQAVWAAVGLVAMAVCSRVDYRLLRPAATPLLLLSMLLLALVLVVGTEAGGSRRWIPLGLFNFQPSEVAKFAVVAYLAAYTSRQREGLQRFWTGLLPALCVVGVTAGLILLEPDFGTAAAMLGTAMIIFFAAGARVMHLAIVAASALPAAGLLIWMEPYRVRRLMAFIDPWADKMDSGWNVIQSLLAIGSGGLFGLGLGEGRQKYLYVPEQHTDFIFSILGEELGFFGAAMVLGLFFILGWRGFRAALRAPDPFGCILAVGLTAMIVCQALLNIGVVTGSLPVTGMTLPLISFGGSSLVVSLAAVGVLLSISRRGREPGVGWHDDFARPGDRPGVGRVELRKERSRAVVRADPDRSSVKRTPGEVPSSVDVLIGGGGTGGHIYPGLAVAEALTARRPGIRIAFVGTRRGLEMDIVPRAGYPLYTIPARGLARRASLALVGSLWQAGAGVWAAWRLLGRVRPRVVLGTGGYAAAPVLAAAFLRRLPVVVQEQNAYPGLTNRLLGRFATCIALGSGAARPYFPRNARVVVTGNPIRAGITGVSREEGMRRLGLERERRAVFIVGASQGARTLNEAVIAGADRLRSEDDLQFILVTGKQQFADVCRRLQARWGEGVPVDADGRRWGNVWVWAYIDDMGAAYAAADLMVARAGAMSLAEMTARGVPAILVPLPHAAEGHQEKNARELEEAGAAVLLPDDECRTRLISTLLDVVKDEARLQAMARASSSIGRPNAARTVAALLEEHLGPGR